MKFDLRKSFKKLRKRLKTACITAVLVTSWQAGQQARADLSPPPNYGDEVTLKFSGTISPSSTDVSHLFLIYETGASSWAYDNIIKLGDFTSGQTTPFSVSGKGYYRSEFYWFAAGLYGDISSGQYIEGINGVVLGINAQAGDSWNTHFQDHDENTVFNKLLNDNPSDIRYYTYSKHYAYGSYLEISESSVLFNFSNASNNGNMQIQSEIVPEPVSIILFGTGGMIVVALRRRDNKNQAG